MAEEYNKLTVQQLKDQLTKRKLPVTGKKSDLIMRLLEADEVITKRELDQGILNRD